jgi:hypothetical protein
LAWVPKRLSKSTVPPPDGMRVGGKPRVYWLTITVLPSAVIDTFAGSSDLPLF